MNCDDSLRYSYELDACVEPELVYGCDEYMRARVSAASSVVFIYLIVFFKKKMCCRNRRNRAAPPLPHQFRM
jgi:hypothetical protein